MKFLSRNSHEFLDKGEAVQEEARNVTRSAVQAVKDLRAGSAGQTGQMATPQVTTMPTAATPPVPAADVSEDSGHIGQNIAAVHDFYSREEHQRSASQRHAESIGGFVGRPAFLVVILLFVSVWMGVNLALMAWGKAPFDEPPFIWLQGLTGLAALLTATVVLIKQNRVAKLGEQRDHLDLKVTLLIEQKTAKLIDLIEELRRDLPNVKNRHDSGAALMQQAMSPEGVLAALDEEVTSPDGSISASTAVPAVPAIAADPSTDPSADPSAGADR